MAEKKFGSDTYRCDKLDAEGAMRLLLRTTKMFGPASKVLSALTATDKSKVEAMSVAAIAEFVGKLDEDEAVAYVKDLICLCRCNGEPAIFGVTPQDLGEVFQVAFWVLEVQFRDFLGGSTVKPLVRRAMAGQG
jgi:hypothetical protein